MMASSGKNILIGNTEKTTSRIFFFKREKVGTSLVVQWWRLHAANSGGPGSILAGELDPTCSNQEFPGHN